MTRGKVPKALGCGRVPGRGSPSDPTMCSGWQQAACRSSSLELEHDDGGLALILLDEADEEIEGVDAERGRGLVHPLPSSAFRPGLPTPEMSTLPQPMSEILDWTCPSALPCSTQRLSAARSPGSRRRASRAARPALLSAAGGRSCSI